MSIAQTIANQMGGIGRLRIMVNANNFVDLGNGLRFKFMKGPKKINMVSIILDPSDTYTVEFGWIYKNTYQKVSVYSDIYCDMLIDIFESKTQLALTL